MGYETDTLVDTGRTAMGLTIWRMQHSAVRDDPGYVSLILPSEAKRQLEVLYPGSLVQIIDMKLGFVEFIYLTEPT